MSSAVVDLKGPPRRTHHFNNKTRKERKVDKIGAIKTEAKKGAVARNFPPPSHWAPAWRGGENSPREKIFARDRDPGEPPILPIIERQKGGGPTVIQPAHRRVV